MFYIFTRCLGRLQSNSKQKILVLSSTIGSLLKTSEGSRSSLERYFKSGNVYHVSRSSNFTDSDKGDSGGGSGGVGRTGWTQTCGCCGLRSKGDKELSDYLTKELKEQSFIWPSRIVLPGIEGFEVSTNGPKVILQRNSPTGDLTISFNINNSLEEDNEYSYSDVDSDDLSDLDDEIPLVSNPSFLVEISKVGQSKLALHCTFSKAEEIDSSDMEERERQFINLIQIENVAILKVGEDLSSQVYSVSGRSLHDEFLEWMHRLLLNHGINEEFMIQLTNFSTVYERKLRLKFLEQLKEFVNCDVLNPLR